MTSPVRKRRDRSRKRIAAADALEIVENAKRLHPAAIEPRREVEPLTRSDCVLIGRAVRADWDVPEVKRSEIVTQLVEALHGDDVRLTIAAAQVLVKMQAANLLDERSG